MSAADLKEMMDNWTKLETEAKTAHPDASDEEIYQLVAGAMRRSLGM